MGVVTASSSASPTQLGLDRRFSSHQPASKRPLSLVLAFKTNKPKKIASVSPCKPVPLPIETAREEHQKRLALVAHPLKGIQAVSANVVSPYTPELDFNEAAAKLESLYNLNYACEEEVEKDIIIRRGRRRRRNNAEDDEKEKGVGNVVRNKIKKAKRLSLDKRIELKKHSEDKISPSNKKKLPVKNEDEKLQKLVREYSGSTDLVSLDWKKMKMPPVLPSSEHALLFKLMQPLKTLGQVKEDLQRELGREPTYNELGEAVNMTAVQVTRHIEVGRAARNKLIKHNLRLVLFVMNKYFQEFANNPNFQDLCQAGVKGLITAIDRFEPNRKLRLSTYSLFWIRHAIIRSMTVSSFTRVSFGLESVRVEIQKAKLKLMFELNRMPAEEEIAKRVGISPGRYQEVMRPSKSVFSLNSRHATTQEEFINGITDTDGDKRRQPALLRLALDDVLDSLKPKESLVIRQRYGLDGKGDRTLGEIAGNLNISREMVRKHEMKALMKLKHPTRMDYLRQYIY